MSLVIYSNPIKTGKSTSLFNWCYKQKKTIQGFIMMEVNSQKVIYNANNLQPFIYPPSTNEIKIGSYVFDASIFSAGNAHIIDCLKQNKFDIFCLDEIGKLELQNNGWHNGLMAILEHEKQNNQNLYLIIVRDYLIENVISKYNLNNYLVINSLEKLQQIK